MIGVTQLLSEALIPNNSGQTGVESDPIPTSMGATTQKEAGSYVRAIEIGNHGKKIGVGRSTNNRTDVYSLNSPGVLTNAATTYYDVDHYRGVEWNFTGTQAVGRSHTGNTTYRSLTTPWTVAGALITPGTNFNNQRAVVFSSDGFHFNIWNESSQGISVYSLETQNDITSTATLLGTYTYNSSSRPGIYSSSNTTGFISGRLVRNGNYFCGYAYSAQMKIYSLANPYDLSSMTLVRTFNTPNASSMAIDPTMNALAWYTSDSTATVYTAPLT